MNRQGFLEYIDHFNNRRYDAVTSYFAPDISVEYFTSFLDPKAPARTLHGPKEFAASYMALHEYTREALELGDFMTCDDLMFVELYTEFHCFKEPPSSTFMTLMSPKKGEVAIMTNWVIYNMTPDDKMKRIRIAHFRMHDPKNARL
jgi:hypothetical protein